MKCLQLLCLSLCLAACGKAPEQTVATPPETSAPATVQATAPTTIASASEMVEKAGLPPYPGATIKGQASTPGSPEENRITLLLTTPDPAQKVVAYYKDQLGSDSSSSKEATHVVGRTKNNANVIVDIEPDGKGTKMTVRAILYTTTSSK